MPFKLTEGHSHSFEDVIDFSAFLKLTAEKQQTHSLSSILTHL